MNRNAIWTIIILMSSALIGIAIIQFFWIKWQVDLREEAFEEKIRITLTKVRDRLHDDPKTMSNLDDLSMAKKLDIDGKKFTSILKKQGPRDNRYSKEISSIYYNATQHFENIDKDKLAVYMLEAMQSQGLELNYDYGIFSRADNGFTIINGNYVAAVSGNSSSIEQSENKGLYNAPYTLDVFKRNAGDNPGYLALFFPGKTGYLWSKVLLPMLASFLFTGLILFCFSYTIYVILKQKRVSEMKTDFINNMTHEFKTPIATISLATDSITNTLIINDENKVKRFAGIIKEENKRMLNQVEKVLQMAKIDKQDFKLNLTKIDLHALIETAARNMSLKIDKRNGELKTDLKAKNALIQGDQNHISNIIHNLLDNAEKYSADAPIINISTQSMEDGVNITISDKGIGMTKDALKNIFDKFYRVHTGNRHDIKGFGLGLSYVKALVAAHQGTINVKSELGKGSSFTVFLPFYQ